MILKIPRWSCGSKEYNGSEMALRKVTAIVRTEMLEEIEQHLQAIGVPGISVTYVKGFGNYANFFKSPPRDSCTH